MHILIIGAGMAGVGTGVVAVQAGHKVTIVDRRSTVGGLWAPGGHFPLARLQETGATYHFPGHHWPSATREWPSAAEVAAYVRSHAVRGGLRDDHFRLSTAVTGMDRVAGGGWDVTLVPVATDHPAPAERLRVDWVVVATGREGGPPTTPTAVKGLASFRGRTLSDRDTYGMELDELLEAVGVAAPATYPDVHGTADGQEAPSPSPPLRPSLPPSVVIDGYGKTAMDLAMTLTDDGRTTAHIVAAQRHWYMPYNFLGFLRAEPLLYTRAAGVPSPCWVYTTPVARALAGALWPLAVLYGWLLAAVIRASVLWHPNLVGPASTAGRDYFRNSFAMVPDGFRQRLAAGRIVVHAPDRVEGVAGGTSLRLASGAVLPAAALLSCRGSDQRSSLSFLPPAAVDALYSAGGGVRLYRHMVHPDVPRVGFVLAATCFGCGTAVHLQAMWLAELWAGRLVLPSPAAQRAEMERVGAVKRELISCNREPDSLILDRFFPFFDELCTDLGVEPMRVRGVAGYVAQLNPDWYAGVGDELRRRCLPGEAPA